MIQLFPSTRVGRLRILALFSALVVTACFRPVQFVILLSSPLNAYSYCRYSPQEGDVVFQSLPRCDLVDAIEGVTHTPWSHCGVVLRNDKNQWVVIESIVNVHETPLLLWIFRSRCGNFAAYRLDTKYSPLMPDFKKNLLSYMGRLYDFDYDMTNDRVVYCSDLVYLAFSKASGEKMGKLEKLGDLSWKPYEHFILSEQGGRLPLERVMITPASLSHASQLHEVYRAGLN